MYFFELSDRRTRLAAYCCMYSWLSVGGADSQVETLLDKLLPTMLADIHTQKPTVKLRVRIYNYITYIITLHLLSWFYTLNF